MIKLIYGKYFLKNTQRLPKKIQEKLSRQLEILKKKAFHKSLRIKVLTAKLTGFYSFRVIETGE